jgi:hypothetical protein
METRQKSAKNFLGPTEIVHLERHPENFCAKCRAVGKHSAIHAVRYAFVALSLSSSSRLRRRIACHPDDLLNFRSYAFCFAFVSIVGAHSSLSVPFQRKMKFITSVTRASGMETRHAWEPECDACGRPESSLGDSVKDQLLSCSGCLVAKYCSVRSTLVLPIFDEHI